MRIVSVTITSDRAAIIGDALASVAGYADEHVIVDLGTDEATREVVREHAPRARYVRHQWADDTAAARNAGLVEAARWGDVALILDTDERMVWKLPRAATVKRLKRVLRDSPSLLVLHVSGVYSKVRFVGLPAHARYQDAVHEWYPSRIGDAPVDWCRFDELERDAASKRRRDEWIVRVLSEDIKRRPDYIRNYFNRAEAHLALGLLREACEDYAEVCNRSKWPEEVAWAHFRLADCLWQLASPDALRVVEEGCALAPDWGDMHWLRAEILRRSGRLHEATEAARVSIARGLAVGDGARVKRAAFREPAGLYEGPFATVLQCLEGTSPDPSIVEGLQRLHDAARSKRLEN
jgi:glycosyltransferase involved in cell wall biosynthesis